MLAAVPEPEADFSFLAGRRHAVLAVSGGSDSMGLLHLAHRWTINRADAPALTVLTVDHGLRPESAGEARQVAAWSRALRLPHVTLLWQGEKPPSGVQARARAARYGLMAEWARAHDADAILTGHTLDDQAETVLMRLRRSASPASLAGIPALGHWQGIRLIRPLLACRRQIIRDLLGAIGQAWVEDPSNEESRFERVRTRAELAGLAGAGVTAERLAALAQACARTDSLLDRCARLWLAEHLDERPAGVGFAPFSQLSGLPHALQQRILGLVVRHYGGGHLLPEPKELSRLVEWINAGAVRCTLAGAVLGRRKHVFWAAREVSRISSDPLVIGAAGEAVWDGRFRIIAPEGAAVTAAGDDCPDLGEGVPVHARKAYPRVVVPEGGVLGNVRVEILRLTPS